MEQTVVGFLTVGLAWLVGRTVMNWIDRRAERAGIRKVNRQIDRNTSH